MTCSVPGSTMASVWSCFESASSDRCGVDCAPSSVASERDPSKARPERSMEVCERTVPIVFRGACFSRL